MVAKIDLNRGENGNARGGSSKVANLSEEAQTSEQAAEEKVETQTVAPLADVQEEEAFADETVPGTHHPCWGHWKT